MRKLQDRGLSAAKPLHHSDEEPELNAAVNLSSAPKPEFAIKKKKKNTDQLVLAPRP
ncbi:protein of unknown function [Hyphomicrobium sp. MC1]|nr:protein of unknown function [Hyphomicrobium sp. MC1]